MRSAGLEPNRHSQRLDGVLDGPGELIGQPLLLLETASEEVWPRIAPFRKSSLRVFGPGG